jgi:glutathione S-transferase
MLAARAAQVKVEIRVHRNHDALKTKEYLKVNPKGLAPSLETPEGILNESDVISRYLASLAPERKLMGGESLWERAQVDQWMAFNSRLDWPLIAQALPRMPIKKGNEILSDLIKQFKESAVAQEEHLADRTYFVGNQLTLADTNLVSMVKMAYDVGSWETDFAASFPNITRWYYNIAQSEIYSFWFGNFYQVKKAMGTFPQDQVVDHLKAAKEKEQKQQQQ